MAASTNRPTVRPRDGSENSGDSVDDSELVVADGQASPSPLSVNAFRAALPY